MYDWYNDEETFSSSRKNKDIILYALKFLKHHNKIDKLVYGKNDIERLGYFANSLYVIARFNMNLIKMIYGKVQTGYVYHSFGGVNSIEEFREEQKWIRDETHKKELETIVKWAEAIK